MGRPPGGVRIGSETETGNTSFRRPTHLTGSQLADINWRVNSSNPVLSTRDGNRVISDSSHSIFGDILDESSSSDIAVIQALLSRAFCALPHPADVWHKRRDSASKIATRSARVYRRIQQIGISKPNAGEHHGVRGSSESDLRWTRRTKSVVTEDEIRVSQRC